MASRLYSGRYSLGAGQPIICVALHTPDEQVARKRLRDIIVEKQREAEGLIAPAAVREAAAMPLTSLVGEYEQDLRSRELAPRHIRDSVKRLRRMLKETRWRRLVDVRPDSFIRWRATLHCAAKTRKEYHVSANAFFNWLVRSERAPRNPVGAVDMIDVRGKQVRNARAFTDDEIARLLKVAGVRRIVYLTLLYTGQRKSEVRQLVVADLHLDGPRPFVLFREGTTKDKDKRAVPLHPSLAAALRAFVPKDAEPTQRVFWKVFPHYETMRVDFQRAGIEHKDALGRVLHFHSFRKTWQTLGVRHGVNQRVAQELLGHSDANLTAKIYTDVPALAMHAEIEKLPWFGHYDKYAHKKSRKWPLFAVCWPSLFLSQKS